MVPTIKRSRTGEITASPWHKYSNSEWTVEVAMQFVRAYGFLVKQGESISVNQFIARVKSNYVMDGKRQVEMSAFCLCTCGNLDLMTQFESFNEPATLVALGVEIRLHRYILSLRARNISESKIEEMYQAMTTEFPKETENA